MSIESALNVPSHRALVSDSVSGIKYRLEVGAKCSWHSMAVDSDKCRGSLPGCLLSQAGLPWGAEGPSGARGWRMTTARLTLGTTHHDVLPGGEMVRRGVARPHCRSAALGPQTVLFVGAASLGEV